MPAGPAAVGDVAQGITVDDEVGEPNCAAGMGGVVVGLVVTELLEIEADGMLPT